jgi:hypothetical protein
MTDSTEARTMTDPRPPIRDPDTAAEADLAVRKAGREANARANGLANRLEEVELHHREARWVLERAGMLTRRREEP